jgi:hypothetical protein
VWKTEINAAVRWGNLKYKKEYLEDKFYEDNIKMGFAGMS